MSPLKGLQLAYQYLLLRPLFLLSNLLIWWTSLLCRYSGSLFIHCSKPVNVTLSMLCPFELKCSPVAFSNFLLLMYPLCSPQRVVSFLPAAMPKYWKLQLLAADSSSICPNVVVCCLLLFVCLSS